jgi:hypothetical protein
VATAGSGSIILAGVGRGRHAPVCAMFEDEMLSRQQGRRKR